MNYKILQKETFSKSLRQIVIENRNLEKTYVDFLLNPTNKYVEMPMSIKNIDNAIKLFIEEIDNNSTIGIVYDP